MVKHLSILLLLVILPSIVISCGNSVVVDDETEELPNTVEATTSESSQAEVVTTEAASMTTEATTVQSDPANFNTIGGLQGNIASTSFCGFQDNTLYYMANYDLDVLDLTTGDISKIKNAAGNYYQILGEYAFQATLWGLTKLISKLARLKI